MSHSFYNYVHVLGIIVTFLALGGAIVRGLLRSEDRSVRKLVAITFGVGMFLVLLGGFGMLARLDVGFPNWVVAKVCLWLVLGGLLTAAAKKPGAAKGLWIAVIVLGALAAWLGLNKPF